MARKSIRKRLIRLGFLTGSITVVIATAAIIVWELISFRESIVRRIESQAQIIGANASAAMLFDDPSSAADTLSALEAEPSITSATIIRGDEVFARYSRPGADTSVLPAALPSARSGQVLSSNGLLLWREIVLDGESIGSVAIHSDLSELRSALRGAGVFAVLLAAAMLTIGFVFARRFGSRISNPILELAGIARRVGEEKDYGLRARVTTNDEIGLLTKTFNSMLDEIEARDSEVRESRQKFAALFASSNDAVVLCSTDGRIVDANQQALRLFEIPRQDLSELGITDLHPEAVRNESLGAFETVKRQGMNRYEIVCRRLDGATFEADVSASLVDTPTQTLVQNIIRDVSDRKRTERDLAQARDQALEAVRLKSAFLANMSHEIRTPLNVILGYTGLIRDTFEEDEGGENAPLFDGIDVASNRLFRTVHAILDISRIESGSFDLRPETVSLAEVLEERVEESRTLAVDKSLEIRTDVREDDTAIWFDRYCLVQIVANLVDNAVKFTNRGSISIELDAIPDGDLQLRVADTGIGIDASYLERLFEPFSQEVTGYSRPYEGSGLGLALVHHYVEMNGARIEATSAKGQGSTFTVIFPREIRRTSADEAAPRAEAEVPPPPTPRGRPQEGERHTVLVVEDDPTTQFYMESLLGPQYDVRLAATGDEMRAALDDGSAPEVVLMDLSLKGSEDGLELTRYLRRHSRWSRIPVVVTTAHVYPEDRERLTAAGCNAFLTKPIDHGELFGVIEALLQDADRHIEPHETLPRRL